MHFFISKGGEETEKHKKSNGQASTSKENVIKKIEEETTSIAKETELVDESQKRPTIILHSQKMKELKDLLLAEKLNTQAISLHLTAQSQVQVGKKGRGSENDSIRPKRARRE